jgi:predicted transcriptional regulator
MKLQQKIDEAGLGIVELSKLCKVSRSTIYSVLNGNKVKNCTLGKIAKVLGCTIKDIKE